MMVVIQLEMEMQYLILKHQNLAKTKILEKNL